MFPLIDQIPGWWPDLVVAVLIGPLAVAGVAKLVTRPEKLEWPVEAAVLRAPQGPRLVGLTELAAAVAIVLVPGRSAAVVALAAYASLTAMAYVMRGRRCACFGVARLAAVGRFHIGANAAAAVVAAGLALADPPGSQPALRAVVGVVATSVTLGAVLALDRRRRGASDAVSSCEEQVNAVRLYVSDSCPACRSLKQLLAAMEPARRDAVVTIVIGKEERVPAAVSGLLGVPSAVGLNAAGEPVCSPVSGIGAVKALVDTITLIAPVAVSGR
jgi:hypothetical protein